MRILSSMALSQARMMRALMESDPAMNGRFITGVHSTGIYCLPSCHAKKPKPENVRFYPSPDEARDAGLRACKKCRPDDYYAGKDEDLDLLEATVAQVFATPVAFADVAAMARHAAISNSGLHSALRTHFHDTPGGILNLARLSAARRLLGETTMGVVEVGFDVGFDATSTFYERFRACTGLTPAEYRRLSDSASFVMHLPASYPLTAMRDAWERDPESATDQWVGDTWRHATSGSLFRATFDSHTVSVVVEEGSSKVAHRVLVRLLGLEQETTGFERMAMDSPLSGVVSRNLGLRIPQTATPYEGMIWAIVGQQVNLAFAFKLRTRLCHLAGRPVGDLYEHPTPERVAGLTVEQLLPLQFSRRKAEYVIGCSREIAEGRLDLEALATGSATRAEQALLSLRGIGPWAANYMLLRALGFADGLPVGDTGLTSGLQRALSLETRPGVPETMALMEPFRPYRSLACFHIWRSLHGDGTDD